MSGKRRSARSVEAATALTEAFMMAPAVAFLRLPVLAEEARGMNPWRVETMRTMAEKSAALAEGAVAAQFSYYQSASRFWIEVMTGRAPSLLNGVAAERCLQAALAPAGRAVRANYRRLGGSK